MSKIAASPLLRLSDFSEVIGSFFDVSTESSDSIQLELLEAVKIGDRPSQSTPNIESFSLLFRGNSDIYLSQQIWALHHSVLGDIHLFLVPISQQEDGFRYEAIFN